jgi:hypothetical protein
MYHLQFDPSKPEPILIYNHFDLAHKLFLLQLGSEGIGWVLLASHIVNQFSTYT